MATGLVLWLWACCGQVMVTNMLWQLPGTTDHSGARKGQGGRGDEADLRYALTFSAACRSCPVTVERRVGAYQDEDMTKKEHQYSFHVVDVGCAHHLGGIYGNSEYHPVQPTLPHHVASLRASEDHRNLPRCNATPCGGSSIKAVWLRHANCQKDHRRCVGSRNGSNKK